jgi:6-phosphogluconolactonase
VNSTTGELSVLPSSPFMRGFSFGNATPHPNGKFLYATSGGAPGITAFSIDHATGALVQLSASPFAATTSFNYTAVDPSGKFLFAVDWVHDTIIGFAIDPATGSLTQLANSTALGAHAASMNIIKAP